MAETQIEWTDATWNPVAGCSIITAGCTNCYAMEMARRLEAMGAPKYQGLTRRSGGRTIFNAAWCGKMRNLGEGQQAALEEGQWPRVPGADLERDAGHRGPVSA